MQPNYRITEKMLNLVGKISQATTQLAIEKRVLHLRKENRIRSIQSSLAIENNSLTLEQVTAILEGRKVMGPPKDIHEVQNAYEAYDLVFQLAPYSVEDFLKAHELLTKGLVKHPGQFRLSDVGVYDSQGQVVHVGARPQFVPQLVSQLFDWAKSSQISDLVKSCILHFELEIIHPFEDGNGRMGRLWQSLVLSRFNPIFEWLPVEFLIYKHQEGYYNALTISNHDDDATVFIEFMLEVIYESLQEYQTGNHLEEDGPELTDKEVEVFQKIKSYLQVHSHISNAQAKEVTGLSQASVRRYLASFLEKDLLTMTGSTRDRQYHLKIH